MIFGQATPEGASRFASRFPRLTEAGFFRPAQGLNVASLGLGTYLGGMDEETDRSYAEAVVAALRGGINLVDTSLNYRRQRSERAIARGITELFGSGELERDELVVCTKAGFLTAGAVPEGTLEASETVGAMHSLAPDFLADQVERSRANLGLKAIDVMYVHNPEMQLEYAPRMEFERRMLRAFETLETLANEGKIHFYGTATWSGFRKNPGDPLALSLSRLIELARAAGGENHRFRFLQLPFNLGMTEAFTERTQNVNGGPVTVLEAAAYHGVTVVASASLMQARLTKGLPEAVAEFLPGPATDAQRAIQFVRSTPGITVALAGMSKPAHVTENLGVATCPPAAHGQYLRLYDDPDG